MWLPLVNSAVIYKLWQEAIVGLLWGGGGLLTMLIAYIAWMTHVKTVDDTWKWMRGGGSEWRWRDDKKWIKKEQTKFSRIFFFSNHLFVQVIDNQGGNNPKIIKKNWFKKSISCKRSIKNGPKSLPSSHDFVTRNVIIKIMFIRACSKTCSLIRLWCRTWSRFWKTRGKV